MKFDGYLKVYPVNFEQVDLPNMETGEALDFIKLEPTQHFTKPPARYNEASLIKALEEHGIGRPSTYAPIITTIQTRNYIEKDDKRSFRPTEIGLMVNDILVKHFPQIVDIGFTAKMEEDFDEIAEGKMNWVSVMRDFYTPFKANLDEKYKEVESKNKTAEVTDKLCPKCGANLVIKMGRFGKFTPAPNSRNASTPRTWPARHQPSPSRSPAPNAKPATSWKSAPKNAKSFMAVRPILIAISPCGTNRPAKPAKNATQ